MGLIDKTINHTNDYDDDDYGDWLRRMRENIPLSSFKVFEIPKYKKNIKD